MPAPFVLSSDLVSAYPAKSVELADFINGYKLDTGPVQNPQTGTSYTFALSDTTKTVTANNAAASAYTVPPQSAVIWEAYTVLRLVNLGAGLVTITAGAGVTITGAATVNQYGSLEIIRTGLNTWTVTGSAGRILQVVQAYKADVFSTTSTSYVDVTGLSVSITPISTASKVLVIAKAAIAGTLAGSRVDLTVLRAATAIGNSSTKDYFSANLPSRSDGLTYNALGSTFIHYLDSPATTAATTYKMQIRTSSGTAYVNRGLDDDLYRGTSDITLMEISA